MGEDSRKLRRQKDRWTGQGGTGARARPAQESPGQGREGAPGRVAARAAVPHRAACLIVVLVHGRARVWPVFSRVRKLPGHEHPEVGVLATAAPLPALAGRPLMMRIAAADGGGALGTGARDCEGHARRGDGVNEGRFAGGCREGVGKTLLRQGPGTRPPCLRLPILESWRALQPRGKGKEPRLPSDPLWLAQLLGVPTLWMSESNPWAAVTQGLDSWQDTACEGQLWQTA